jgi:hypothetical protein
MVYLLTAVVGMNLIIAQQSIGIFSAFASESSDYNSGYEHGCDDAGISDPGDRYINQPEKGPSFHTNDFMDGYDAGFNSCRSGGGDGDEFYQPPSEAPSNQIPREIQPGPREIQPGPREIQPGPREIQPGPNDDGEGTPQGGIDWIKICNDLRVALLSSCEVLVNPDNTLTFEGERAVGCIRNGIALAGGGTFLLALPLPLVIAALQILEEPTGCGGIVEWGLIGSVGGLKGIINRLT